MSKKNLFEIPESLESVVFRPGREIAIDGKTVVEVDRASQCAQQLMSHTAIAYCERHWFNPVFMYSTGNLPVLIGFVFDEKSYNSFSTISCTGGAGSRIMMKLAPRNRIHR